EVGVFKASDLENNTFDAAASSANYIKGFNGPSGLVLDSALNELIVFGRFDNTVNVVNLANNSITQTVSLTNPEPSAVVQGRSALYDPRQFISNGETSCASCHTFGDKDELAWDLGQPQEKNKTNPIALNLANAQELAIGEKLFDTTEGGTTQ